MILLNNKSENNISISLAHSNTTLLTQLCITYVHGDHLRTNTDSCSCSLWALQYIMKSEFHGKISVTEPVLVKLLLKGFHQRYFPENFANFLRVAIF